MPSPSQTRRRRQISRSFRGAEPPGGARTISLCSLSLVRPEATRQTSPQLGCFHCPADFTSAAGAGAAFLTAAFFGAAFFAAFAGAAFFTDFGVAAVAACAFFKEEKTRNGI